MTDNRDAQLHAALGHAWDETRCRVCGWPLSSEPTGCRPGDCAQRPPPKTRADAPPAYTTDIAAAQAMEVELEVMGLQWRYLLALNDVLQTRAHVQSASGDYESLEFTPDIAWVFWRATPAQRVQAGLQTIGDTDGSR